MCYSSIVTSPEITFNTHLKLIMITSNGGGGTQVLNGCPLPKDWMEQKQYKKKKKEGGGGGGTPKNLIREVACKMFVFILFVFSLFCKIYDIHYIWNALWKNRSRFHVQFCIEKV